jgi:hypothetical protein
MISGDTYYTSDDFCWRESLEVTTAGSSVGFEPPFVFHRFFFEFFQLSLLSIFFFQILSKGCQGKILHIDASLLALPGNRISPRFATALKKLILKGKVLARKNI